MNGSPNDVADAPPFGLSRRSLLFVLPAVVFLVAFAIGASTGGDAADPGMLPIVRFMAALKLALGFGGAVAVSLLCGRSRRRWFAGLAGAAGMSLGAGFVWSASAFGAGFICFVAGAAVVLVLLLAELQRGDLRRRLAP